MDDTAARTTRIADAHRTAGGSASPPVVGRLRWLGLGLVALLPFGLAGLLPGVEAALKAGLGLAGGGVLLLGGLALWQQARLRWQRRQLEQAVAEHAGWLRKDGRHEGDALAAVCQALRASLLQMSGQLAALGTGGAGAGQVETLRALADASERAQALLADLIDVAQLVGGRAPVRPLRCSLRTLLLDVEAQLRAPAAQCGVALRVDIDPAVPPAVVIDGARVRQLLLHLLGHAISLPGQRLVDIGLRSHAPASGATIVCQVRAGGLPPVLPPGLFTGAAPRQAATSDGGEVEIGLRLAADLAHALGAALTAQALPGADVSWRLQLPCMPAPAPAAEVPSPTGDSRAPALDVLVAEDHEVNRQQIASVLDSLGHRARFVADGRQAVAAAGSGRFDLVLMDLHMPVLDGLQATRAIRALPDAVRAAVPVVALTADEGLLARDDCLLAGMNDFLSKPVDAAALQGCVRRLFGRRASAVGDEGALRPPRAAHAPWGATPCLLDAGIINAALQTLPRERMASMLGSFFAEGPASLERMHLAVREGQPQALGVTAQALRGAALNLGLVAVAATAEALHGGAPHLPAHEVVLLLKQLEEQLRRSRQALEEAELMAPAQVAGIDT